MGIAEDLIPEYRRVALARLERAEAAWQAVLTRVDDNAAQQIHHEIHTLKGESRLVGFSEVHQVCHKLEDLLEVARGKGYAIDDDFDLAVNMAFRFLAMLVRKKVGAQLSGIDLPGFVRQIDSLIREVRGESSQKIRLVSRPVEFAARVPAAMRAKLAGVALDLFVEYGLSFGTRRNRLRASWHALREMIWIQRAIVGPSQLVKHKTGTASLARELGKQVDLALEVETAEVSAEMFNAIDVGVLHIIRNAIDHGIETPPIRVAAGKPPRGKITIKSGMRNNTFEISVEDDGAGVDFERIHARGVELGLIKSSTQSFDGDRWVELICQPGLSTRHEAGDVSGRGVGLDAVRATVLDVGGKLTMTSQRGAGTTWTIAIPGPTITFHAHVFRTPGLPFPVAVDDSWQLVPERTNAKLRDVADFLGASAVPADGRAYFAQGDTCFSFAVEEPPVLATVRRVIAAPATLYGEIITHDAVEGLLLRPEQL